MSDAVFFNKDMSFRQTISPAITAFLSSQTGTVNQGNYYSNCSFFGGFNCSQHGLEDPQEVPLKPTFLWCSPLKMSCLSFTRMLQPIAIMQAENAEASDLIGGERWEMME